MTPGKVIEVRNRTMGGGTPLICTPLVGRTRERVLAEAASVVKKNPDVVEWRVDYFDGIADPARLAERVPTICFTHAHLAPSEIAQRLAADGIYVWHGNYYALPLTETLGLEPDGAVRVGLLHYNTPEEVDRFLAALKSVCG